jgi:hypothetical protein
MEFQICSIKFGFNLKVSGLIIKINLINTCLNKEFEKIKIIENQALKHFVIQAK